MSDLDDELGPVRGEQPLSPPVMTEPTATAGSLLRASREAAGVTLADLATTLKVPIRKLEALEADRLDDLPDAMFVRALASSMCRALQIDARPVLERLPQNERSPFEKINPSLNAPFKGTMRSIANRSHPLGILMALLRRPAVLVALVLLAGAGVLLLAPSLPAVDGLLARLGKGSATAASAPVMPPGGMVTEDVADGDRRSAAEAAGPLPPSLPAPTAATASRAILSAASALSAPAGNDPGKRPVTTASAPVTRPGTRTAEDSADGNRPSAAEALHPVLQAAPALSAPGGADLVRFEASASCWIEVTDATGKQPLRRLLEAGEAVAVGGEPPLRVTVGRADAVKVLVRGAPLDIAAQTRDNVAHFEVK